MVLFGIDMLERRIELYDRTVDGVMPESTTNIVHGALQLLQFFSFCFVFEESKLFGCRCRDQITTANPDTAQGVLPNTLL